MKCKLPVDLLTVRDHLAAVTAEFFLFLNFGRETIRISKSHYKISITIWMLLEVCLVHLDAEFGPPDDTLLLCELCGHTFLL